MRQRIVFAARVLNTPQRTDNGGSVTTKHRAMHTLRVAARIVSALVMIFSIIQPHHAANFNPYQHGDKRAYGYHYPMEGSHCMRPSPRRRIMAVAVVTASSCGIRL